MKTKFLRYLPLLVGGMLLTNVAAQAQTTLGAGGRLAVVEIKDSSLKDAINLVFRAAGLPLPIIDESAANYFIADVTRTNIDWNDLARSLCQSKNFKMSRNPDGQYVIEPRIIPQFQGGEFGGEGMMGGGMMGGFPGGVPNNPFGGGGAFGGGQGAFGGGNAFGGGQGAFGGRGFTRSSPLITPKVETQSNFQFGGRGGQGGFGGRNNRGGRNGQSTEPVNYTPIQIRHVYAGGIAALFANSGSISTYEFAVPPSAGQMSGGMGGMGGGMMGGMGGGMMGGMGGGMMGGMGGIGGGVGGGIGGLGGGMGGGSFGGFR